MIVNFDHGFSCCLCNVKRNWREYTKEELKKKQKRKTDNTIAKKTWNYLQNTAQKTTDNTNPI